LYNYRLKSEDDRNETIEFASLVKVNPTKKTIDLIQNINF